MSFQRPDRITVSCTAALVGGGTETANWTKIVAINVGSVSNAAVTSQPSDSRPEFAANFRDGAVTAGLTLAAAAPVGAAAPVVSFR